MGYKPESFTLSQSYTHEGVLAGRGMGRGPLALYMIGSLCTARAARNGGGHDGGEEGEEEGGEEEEGTKLGRHDVVDTLEKMYGINTLSLKLVACNWTQMD